MLLYLSANSRKKIGYTPDWLQFTFKEDEQWYELTLDIQGEISYDRDSLSCRCKTEIVPWTLIDCESGDETDLSELSEEEIDELYPNWRIAKIIDKATEFVVGIYPVDDYFENLEHAKDDTLTDCAGHVEIFVGVNNETFKKSFSFQVETNY